MIQIPAGSEITKKDGSSYIANTHIECAEAEAGPDSDFDTKSEGDYCWMHVAIDGEVVLAKFSFESLNAMYEGC